MWEHEYSVETDVDVTRLWETFLDIHAGRLTLPGGDVFRPDGELAVGARIAVTPAGQETMTSVVTEFVPEKAYADETVYESLVLRFSHRFDSDGARTRITHHLAITGEGADEIGPEIGPLITSDFPEQMAALVDAARHR